MTDAAFQELTGTVKNIELLVTNLASSVNDKFQSLDSKVQNLEALVMDLAGSISAVDAKVDALRIDLEEFKDEMRGERRKDVLRQVTVDADLREMRVKLQELQERLEKLEEAA
jgi:predicted RNase H-like nuclease (RuvC/YqgF family)